MRLAKRDDWKNIPMPDERRSVAIDRTYTVDEFTRMVAGRVPEVMEHKWFVFYEEPWLYFNRSWTGVCLYMIRFVAVEGGMSIAEAWAPSEYSHRAPLKPNDTRQAGFDSLELAALLDRQAGRPTTVLWRQYFDSLAVTRRNR